MYLLTGCTRKLVCLKVFDWSRSLLVVKLVHRPEKKKTKHAS